MYRRNREDLRDGRKNRKLARQTAKAGMMANREKARAAFQEARALKTKHRSDGRKSKISVKKYKNSSYRYGFSYPYRGGNRYGSSSPYRGGNRYV